MPFITSETSTLLLNRLSGLAAPIIATVAVLHLLVFIWLIGWARRDLRRMAADFDQFTRELKYRSILERGSNLSDQIDAFLADIKDGRTSKSLAANEDTRRREAISAVASVRDLVQRLSHDD